MMHDFREDALQHARKEYPREACGLAVVVKGKLRYYPCKNISPRDTDFVLDPADYARADELGEIVALFHSHCDEPPDPSQADRSACQASGLPWHIVSLPGETWAYLEPSGYKAPLVGRRYIHGVSDCYALVRDWYREEMGLEIPDFERAENWWHNGGDLILQNLASAGFSKVDIKSMRRGDGLLFKIHAAVPNHTAVYVGENLMIHHLQGRLSSRDVFGGWQQYLHCVVRHN